MKRAAVGLAVIVLSMGTAVAYIVAILVPTLVEALTVAFCLGALTALWLPDLYRALRRRMG